MANLNDSLHAGVADLQSAKDSAVQLVKNIAAEVKARSGNPQAAEDLAATLEREAHNLGAAVMANVHTVVAHVVADAKAVAAAEAAQHAAPVAEPPAPPVAEPVTEAPAATTTEPAAQ